MQEQGGDDSAGHRLGGDVVEVGHWAFEPTGVSDVERQAPEGIVPGIACGDEGGGEGVVGREDRRDVRAEGDSGSAGEGGCVDEQGGALVGRFGKQVA